MLLFRRLIGDHRASVAVEFAFLGLFALDFIVEIMQTGYYFYASAAIERATRMAARQIMTGAVSSQSLSAAQFRSNVLCPQIAAVNFSCAKVITNVQVVNEAVSPGGFYALLNANQTALAQPTLDNTQTSFCIGTASSYIFVQIIYPITVFSPVWRLFSQNVGGVPSYLIQSTAAFRNEPFMPGLTPC